MRVDYRWLDGTSWLKVAFLFVWDIVVIWVGMANYRRGDALIPEICLVLFFVSAYYALALVFNSTTLLIRPTELEIMHGPLPWFGDRVIALDSIESFSYKRRSSGEGGDYYTFYCNLVNRRRHSIFLAVGMPRPERAIKALTKVVRWVEPYRQIPLVNETAGRE